MFGKKSNKGFTLIEVLVVIAIIAILVAVIIPVVGSSTTKARAAADAANLRSTLGALNTVITTQGELEEQVKNIDAPESMYVANCELHVLYTNPGFIEVYFVDNAGNYYGLDYLADVAENNTSSLSTAKPATGGTWYKPGTGKIEVVPGT